MTKSFKSTCSYCGVGCGVTIDIEANQKLVVSGDVDHPTNKGMLCSKGMNLHYAVMDKSDRLLYPSMRYNRSMPMQRVTWDESLNRCAAVFKSIIQKYGPDAVGFYASGQCLTEEYYVINKLIKGFIGSNNIDTNSRLCMSSAVVGYKLTLGEDSVPVSYEDIEYADCFLVTGANPAWCHPILWRRVEARKEQNPDVKIICVDPIKTDTATSADLHLQIHPGTDVTLTNAIGRILIETGGIDENFIGQHCSGFESYKAMVMQRSIEEASAICGIEIGDLYKAASFIKESSGFISMWTMGLNQSVIGVNKNLSLIDLHLITGKIGKEGSGPLSLTGQPNAMGGREVGGLANLLMAHRDLANESHRKEVQDFWNSGPINPNPGYTATEMFEALKDGRMKAIWIICTNPAVSLPNLSIVEEGLKNAKFVIVQDISKRSDTLRFADVILPAAGWLEKEGTMTNSERRITYLPKLIDPPGEARPDYAIITDFAQRLGFEKAFQYKCPAEIYDEHVRSTANTNIDITNLNYDLLKENRSVQWPLKIENNKVVSQTSRLFTDYKFYTSDQKAKIHPVEDQNHSEELDEEYPLILTTVRIRDQWHTMTRTGKVNKLKQHISLPHLEIHPDDAKVRGIMDGATAIIKSRRGTAQVAIQYSARLKKGVCAMPMHFGRINGQDFGRANNLTNSLYDPRSKEPDFKYSAIQVAAFVKPKEKIIIIGAGSAALGFVNHFRQSNVSDEIHVFSKEIFPFYNRILLPDYISGEHSWEDLVKLREDQFLDQKIVVHKGVEIVHLDPKNKLLIDNHNAEHSYDKLIIATGSNAFMPPNIPKINGVLNMRSRIDAETLLPTLDKENPKVVVVGGGLLGLELAASLRQLKVAMTVVNRESRFMSRQLDQLGSDLLLAEIQIRGIDVFMNDEVSAIYGESGVKGLRLRSGRKLDCDAVVFAIGTIPNIALAKSAGLHVKRGIVVDEFMRTSDPSIFAAGEIAEWNDQMWGITLAAEEQAEVISNYFLGNLAKSYKGSLSMNILKIHGLQLCSIGMIEPPYNDNSYEEVIFIDKVKRYYKKCIIHQDKLVGAILIGDKSEFNEYRELIEKKIELSEKRLQLLRSGKPVEPVIGKLVCSCNSVGTGNLQNYINNGCSDLKVLCHASGAGTGCGSCRPEVKRILEEALSQKVG